MKSQWNFLTNHAHGMVCLATGRGLTLRVIAEAVGITERATHRLVSELERDGVAERTRRVRRNHHEVQLGFPLRHPLEENCSVGELVGAVTNGRRQRSD